MNEIKEFIFKLTEFESIEITPSNKIDFENMYLCTNLEILLKSKDQLLIGKESLGESFRSFISHLTKAINCELQLHESLTENLGFIYNEYFDDVPKSMMEVDANDSKSSWVIYNYQMWSAIDDANFRTATWLYNDHNGNIILTVTKTYPWFYIKDGDVERPDFIYYEDFIRDYKPLFTHIIPKERAMQWLDQANLILNSVKKR